MALKYQATYQDIYNIGHQIDIYDDAFSGSVTDINGYAFLNYRSVNDPLDSIRGSGLRVQLEADTGLTFSDLYSEDERTIKVVYKRNSITLFSGWLNPEGWFENYVSDKWVVSFDCVDGLGYLDGLSYVDDSGLFFVGKQTALEIISNCLKRTGIYQNIYTDINIFYTGLSTSLDPLANVYFNAERFVDDDGVTIKSCQEVLKSTLKTFNACITSKNGIWYIYRPNKLFNSAIFSYYSYDYLGSVIGSGSEDLTFLLGSETNGFYPHHASGNQRITNKNSLGAYRINYKYGNAVSLLPNNMMQTLDGLTYSGWVINSTVNMTIPAPGGYGVTLNGVALGGGILQMTSNAIALALGVAVNVRFKVTQSIYPFSLSNIFYYEVILVTGGGTYYLKADGTWILATVTTLQKTFTGVVTDQVTIDSQPIPSAGNIQVLIYTPEGSGSTGTHRITEVYIDNISEDLGNKKGEFHTVERTTKPSSKTDDPDEVFVGDNLANNYIGAIYKNDSVTNTEEWFRNGITEAYPILRIMVEDQLRMKANISRVFYGDIYGFFNYLSVVSIDGLTGLYMVTSYNYDTANNRIQAEFHQIYGDELGDIEYAMTIDYGETVKPTIKG